MLTLLAALLFLVEPQIAQIAEEAHSPESPPSTLVRRSFSEGGPTSTSTSTSAPQAIPTRESTRHLYSPSALDRARRSPDAKSRVSPRRGSLTQVSTWFSPIGPRGGPFEYTPWSGSTYPAGGTMQIWFEDVVEPQFEWSNWGGEFFVDLPSSTGYLVRLLRYGEVVAVGYGKTNWPADVGFPVDDLAPYGMERMQRTFSADDSPKGFAGIIVAPTFTTDTTGRGYHLPRWWAFPDNRYEAAWMRVEYLAGNKLFGRPSDTYRLNAGGWWFTPLAFYWDETPQQSDRNWNVGGPMSDGPTRFTFSIDGYTSATVEADMVPGTHVWWYPVQAPLVPSQHTPTPAMLGFAPPPEEWIVARARAWRDAGIATEFTNLASYLDDVKAAGDPIPNAEREAPYIEVEDEALYAFAGNFYDTSHEAGTTDGVDFGARADAYYRGDTFEHTFESGFGYYRWMPHPSGAQYLLKLWTTYPEFPHVAGYTALSVDHAHNGGQLMMFPLDAAVQGRGQRDIASSSWPVEYTYLVPDSQIGLSYDEPALYLYRGSLPNNREVRIDFDFLPGNALYPSSVLHFRHNSMNYNEPFGFGIYWQAPDGEEGPPLAYRYNLPAPYGPLLASYAVEGFTSDTLHWESKLKTVTQWPALLIAESPDFVDFSPETIAPIGLSPPDPTIVARALEWLL